MGQRILLPKGFFFKSRFILFSKGSGVFWIVARLVGKYLGFLLLLFFVESGQVFIAVFETCVRRSPNYSKQYVTISNIIFN